MRLSGRRTARPEQPSDAAVPVDAAPPAASPERPAGERLGELLVARGLVTPAQLAETLLQQPTAGRKLGALLVELGAVDERVLTAVLAEQLDVPLVDLREQEPDAEVVRLLPPADARPLTALPVCRRDGRIQVAFADPHDVAAVARVAAVLGTDVEPALAAPGDIARATDRAYRALGGVASLVEAFEATDSLRRIAQTTQQVTSDDAPVIHVVNLIVTQALRDRASDVHIEPQGDRIRVRYRIDGALHDVLALPGTMGPALVSRIKILASMNIVERRRPQDGQMGMEVDGRTIDIRVSTVPTIWGEKTVLRLLDRDRLVFRLSELGMPAATEARYAAMVRAPLGLVICAGPTGSGKTTTLYSTLSDINQTERNITTVEDPVEYVFPSINQIQIHEQAGISFATGLRSILRQDPDVILIGEVRDAETARIAVESALTGHLVLSSLHATDAVSALHRFVEMGVEAFLVATTTIGVLSQRLVRRTCPHCRVEYRPSVEELAFFAQVAGADAGSKQVFWQGKGCTFCAHTGYLDRVGVFELLTTSDTVKELLIAGASVEQLRAAAQRQGMQTLLQQGVQLVVEDVTTLAEVMRSIYVV